MTKVTCETVREMVAAGEDAVEVEEHLASCEACRLETARIRQMIQVIESDAEVKVPEHLDRSIRAMLSEPIAVANGILRPGVALALSVIGLIAGIIALAGWLGGPELDTEKIVKALPLVWSYLALGAVAGLPMLIWSYVRRRECNGEVQS